MRLGTKILLVTLAITLGLAGLIIWVVTRDLTEHETERARADIRRAVSDYFQQIDALHDEAEGYVRVLMEDPQNSAQLEALSNDEPSAREHFKLLFGEVLQSYLSRTRPGEATRPAVAASATMPARTRRPPFAFNVMLDFEGKTLLTFAPNDAKLADALSREHVKWPYDPLLADNPMPTRRYLWVNNALYLALGIPLRLQVSQPPTHALFIGYRIDDPWATSLLGDHEFGVGGDPTAAAKAAAERARLHEHETPLRAWFIADNNVVARGVRAGYDPEEPGASVTDPGRLDLRQTIGPIASAGPLDERRHIEFAAPNGEQFVGEGLAFDLGDGHRGALAVASSLTQALARLHHLQVSIAWVTAGVVVIAVLAFRFVSNQIARPIRELVDGTRRVADGQFDKPIMVNRHDELGELGASFNVMAAGLQQRDLVTNTFGKFVDPKLVEEFLNNPQALMPGGEKRVQTVLFTDLTGFTTFSERLDPDDLVTLLNEHLGDAADIVTQQRGIVDKFIGDAVVAFWGPPITKDDEHAGLACRAALRIVRGIHRLDDKCRILGMPPLGIRVGVATGDVLVGIIGSANKYNYTVMGDTANLGSRLEGLNKVYGTSILITERTARAAEPFVLTRRVDRVRVVGRAEPVDLYEVLAERGQENGSLPKRCAAYAEAVSLYERRAWSDAETAFDRVAREFPEDSAARTMAERCAAFRQADPGADWDGVWTATAK
jgi:class 3 adenylate cyclase